jgi:hypothetical protein
MAGTLALTRAELMRLTRNRRYFIFTVALPVVFYLLIAKQVKTTAYGIPFGAYYMVAHSTATPSASRRRRRTAGFASSALPRCPPTPT